jgi:CRISPR/Cas system-associated endonuclease Cas1
VRGRRSRSRTGPRSQRHQGRASFAPDLIEPVRPEVDGFVLDLLARRTFRKGEFTETADGHCRLLAPLTHELA